MGCSGCSTGGSPGGCGNNGSCSSGGCNRMNTYDWLAKLDIYDPMEYDIVEVSFKNGARKAYFKNMPHTRAITGDMVVVDAGNGYDLGRMTLSGDLVRLQLKKRKIREDEIFPPILRIANGRDLERLDEARSIEKASLVRARVISRTLGLNMKLGDVEYRADKRKATFFYTAENRVDFRELVRSYAKEFKVKIEMRQIGARQESSRIGGIGSCGRELCCSTWLTDFKSVSTNAARYQNLSINQSKLSGQCGRLKCCLNYELDSYMDALKHFPKDVDNLKTKHGKARLIKTDIFKKLMYYIYETKEKARGVIISLHIDRVKEIKELSAKGEFVETLQGDDFFTKLEEQKEAEVKFADDVTGVIELPMEKRRKKRKKRRPSNKKGSGQGRGGNRGPNKDGEKGTKKDGPKSKGPRGGNRSQSKGKKSQGKKSESPQAKQGGKPNEKGGNKGPNPNKNKSRNQENRNRNNPKNPNSNKSNNNQDKK